MVRSKLHSGMAAGRQVCGELGERGGFTFVELIVVMLLITVLAGLLLPALTQSRAAAARTHCASNLRNIAQALMAETDRLERFPACGNFGKDPATGITVEHHSWVVDVLAELDQIELSEQWDKDKSRLDPANVKLGDMYVPVLVCPVDISRSPSSSAKRGDLSYVVNGGVGFTAEISPGVHDCPIDWHWRQLDLNANGVFCPPNDSADGANSDRRLFFAMGLFFNETWNWDVTKRYHTTASVTDGLSNTFLVSENVRTGFDPVDPEGNWSSSLPRKTSFYIGNPCGNQPCTAGNVDYARSNQGDDAINSGLTSPEGESSVPNSFHAGGVNMGFCDGRIVFLNELIDGIVYASLTSPAGEALGGTPLEQPVVPSPE